MDPLSVPIAFSVFLAIVGFGALWLARREERRHPKDSK